MAENSSFENILNKRISSGKFRYINEKMYKNHKLSVEEASTYKEIYNDQIAKWPENPNNTIYAKIKEMINNKTLIADIGCGDTKKLNKNHFLFDKFPCNKDVTEADINNIPAETEKFDIVVCSLSLMKDNITRPIKEINRILKINGVFFLAETKSRIVSIHLFIKKLEKHGFKPEYVNTTNKCFLITKLIKTKSVYTNKKLPAIKLKPCLYKRK